MPTHELLTPAQRARFAEIPADLDDRLMARHHTLSKSELYAVRKRRGPENRLGFGVQLALLKFPGRPLRPAQQVPEKIVRYVASQIGVDPTVVDVYARGRDTTRREHFSEIIRVFGFKPFDASGYRELSRWLGQVAAGTDSGPALVEAVLAEMRRRKIVIPGIYTVKRLAWESRRRAHALVERKLTDGLSEEQLERIDALLLTASDTTRSDLVWLRQPPGAPSPPNFQEVIERLSFVRSLGLSANAAREVHQNRLSRLAAEGARMTSQNLATLEKGRRRATLIAYLLQRAAELTDEALEMHERIMAQTFSESENKRDQNFKARGKAINKKLGEYAGVGNALIAAREAGLDPYEVLETVLPWERFVESVAEAEDLALPAAFDYLEHIEDYYSKLRKYAPLLLDSFDFSAAPPGEPLLEAVEVLKDLNATGRRKVPEDVPTSFVKPRWEPYVFGEDGAINRRNFEINLLSELKDNLKSGDVWVSGSNKFKDFEDYLIPRPVWEEMRESFTSDLPGDIDSDPRAYLKHKSTRLHEQLCRVARRLPRGLLEGIRLKDGKIKVTRPKRTEPKGMKEFRRRIYGFLPRIRLTDLIVEVDSWTRFSKHLTHVRSGEPCTNRELIYASILADGTNLGLTRMAEATDDPRVSYKRLAWAADWHVREETYQKAIAEIVNAHYRLPLSSHWGGGTTSSSDGQIFFAGDPRDALSQTNAKYGRGRGVIFYTHISDQYAPFYSRVINTTVRDATYVLDGLLYHESDLKIEEHSTDTEGFTDQMFGATNLLGYRFAPRMRKINTRIIATQWDEVLRLMSSIKTGTVTASLILRKLANYPRQNGLAKALQEIGKIERSLFMLDWYEDLDLRVRINANLNKGEARNALARAVFFNRLGELRDRSYEDQMNRSSGLTFLCAAIAMWNAVYLGRAVETLQMMGEDVPDEYLAHLSPFEWEHITLTGVYHWNLDSPPARSEEYRPLRNLPIIAG